MLHVALVFLCMAQLIHFSSHWLALSSVQYKAHQDKKLRAHLDWSKTADFQVLGNTKPGSAFSTRG